MTSQRVHCYLMVCLREVISPTDSILQTITKSWSCLLNWLLVDPIYESKSNSLKINYHVANDMIDIEID